MKRVHIYFHSRYGQTRRIAERLASRLGAKGMVAGLQAVESRNAGRLELPAEGAVVIGAPIYRGAHPAVMVEFARRHRDALKARPNAMFSVSMASSNRDEASEAEARGYVEQFAQHTGWRADRVACFAGAVMYRSYNFVLRWIMKRIMEAHGRTADTSRDHEFTDWDAVDRFAAELAEAFAATPEAPDAARSERSGRDAAA